MGMGNWFTGRLGGLAIYDGALNEETVAGLWARQEV
jgi:hypothetical protein